MFARDPKVIGRDIRLSGVPYSIVGVMPNAYHALNPDLKLWVPFAFTPEQTSEDARHSNNWGMIATLKPGVTVAQARQRVDALNKANLILFPKYKDLLIGCVNLANLTLPSDPKLHALNDSGPGIPGGKCGHRPVLAAVEPL
jgi:MacB-like periplasmic core domain